MAVRYELEPEVADDELNTLFASAWDDFEEAKGKSGRLRKYSLTYVCAYDGSKLIGFVNLAWDGGVHGFILDTTVYPEFRRRSVGVQFVKRVAEVAKARGLAWLHVDYEPHLEDFYDACGFRKASAGVMELKGVDSKRWAENTVY